MSKKIVVCSIILFGLSNVEAYQKHAITHGIDGGRFGDQILSYAQTRYVSFITSVPFLYRSFPHGNSHLLDFSYDARSYDECRSQFNRTLYIKTGGEFLDFFRQIEDPNTPPTLYILNYFTSDISEWEYDVNRMVLLFNIPWRDGDFHEHLLKAIKPKISIPDLTKENVLNVAVHVRIVDYQHDGHDFALKTPKIDYYKNQIRRVYGLNKGRLTHVFLFSNTEKPLALLQDFQRSFGGENIEFNIQMLSRPALYEDSTVRDFFAMQSFDVLIATMSNFSLMASRLGNVGMVITPVHSVGKFPNDYIDRIQLVSKKSSWFPYELNIIIKN